MKYQVGSRVTGKINNITDLGVFVSLPAHQHGLIFYRDFAGNWERQRRQLQVGQELRVVVLANHKGKLSLSLSRVNDPQLPDPHNRFNKVAAQDFAATLAQVLTESKQELQQLKQAANDSK